jgi:membrane protein YqaA with SNARE-associated domain
MHKFFASIFTLFLSPVGLIVLAALDASMFFFMPLAVEAAIVILTARHRNLVWLFPILAAVGSTAGAVLTFSIGRRIGDEGLKHWIPAAKLKSVERRIKTKGALALGSAALLPPPFPLAPLILTCGALQVRMLPFVVVFVIARLLRFLAIAISALFYGRWILRFMDSTAFQTIAICFGVIAIGGTMFSLYRIQASRRRR